MFDSLVTFLQAVSQVAIEEHPGAIPVEALAKEMGIEVPEMLKNSNIRVATDKDKPGSKRFTISQMKSKFDWLAPLFAQTKCYLICWDGSDDKIHCLHICITCLDGWPGPGCYIHGSYN